MKKISVIIPVYNVENYIEKCIQSVLSQTLNDIEIIVVNDGTLDNSMKKIEKYRDKLIIINQENQGLSAARNTGLKYATGEYVFFLDSDDWIEKTSLETLYNNSGNSDIVFSNYYFFDETKNLIFKNSFDFDKKIFQQNLGKYFLTCNSEIIACSKLYKRVFLIKNSLEFTSDIIHEDEEFTFKVYMLSNKIKILDKFYGYYYRVNRKNSIMSSYNIEKGYNSIKQIENNLKYFYEGIEDPFIKVRTLLKIWSLYLHRERLKKNISQYEKIKYFEREFKNLIDNSNFSFFEKLVIKKEIRKVLNFKNLCGISIFDFFYFKHHFFTFRILFKMIRIKLKRNY